MMDLKIRLGEGLLQKAASNFYFLDLKFLSSLIPVTLQNLGRSELGKI